MKKKMSKKYFVYIGMIAGLLTVIMGILVIAGTMGGEIYRPSAKPFFDYGFATFGADFYTYVTNNAADAAAASKAAAENLGEIIALLKNVCGIALIAGGLFMLCFFGVQYAECAQAARPETPAEKPIAEVVESVEESEEAADESETEGQEK